MGVSSAEGAAEENFNQEYHRACRGRRHVEDRSREAGDDTPIEQRTTSSANHLLQQEASGNAMATPATICHDVHL